ncbi:uncharacterized protein ASPGLDRAFT_50104 [Aspergillus glaucus CBS 516.65]|uniref:Uncharacterized protein n=1 Tax=Aspergillus glaucus CBS 516.65 TaxID=1160497 RepID=A0A1L9VCL6_ASPGL|nr:hypothetical protein ASPGLDRAFT_50104 [Aspergillus glaucus CBS 516.65]OJJ81582.1 hypothetical protein ASPGLDRAFT_50104 [Aspergillus glaucus CBS 516.65]
MPNWSFDFTESILNVNDRRLKVEELLSEYANSDLNERYAVVNDLDVDTNRPGFIRFRYDLYLEGPSARERSFLD